jgi:Na+/phosphate symporter
MLIWIALVVCVVGVIVYLATEKPKPMEIGRLMFAIGLLAWLLQFPRFFIGH